MTARALPLLVLSLVLAAPPPARAADTWTNPHPGIRHLYRTTATPWRIHALVIDLCADGVRLRATMSVERQQTVSSFAGDVGAQAAINADFFSYEDYHTIGLAVGNGERWSDTADTTGSGFLAFGDDRVLFSGLADVVDPPPDWMREVVSGHPRLVTAGEPLAADSGDFCTTRHPRTAAGFSRDRRTLILAVVDGRSSISVGMQCTEIAELMAELGAWDALNLDGGGSTTMWISGDGVVNDPSDGSQRVVANHLAVIASGAGDPGSCDRSVEEASIQPDAYGGSLSTDVNADGLADLCARYGVGFRCYLADGGAFPSAVTGPEWSDALGWDDPARWTTIRMGDIDGDGQADVCGRGPDGVDCHLGAAAGFGAALDGPGLTDAGGWVHPQYYGTFRMADVNGDGLADLCMRGAAGFRCYRSNGAGFEAPFVLADLSDGSGWDVTQRYGTIRMADVDGDGSADLCALDADGVRCWRSLGDGFDAPFAGPAWSQDSGWGLVQYWSTLRLVDVDGDGRADLCARAAAGFRCHLSTGAGFGAAIDGPAWSDDSGWADHANYATIRMADLDGDGSADVCARANAGIRCHRWEGAGFGAAITGPELSDTAGWNRFRYYSTIRLADVTGDGRADLCARASTGMLCYPSNGAGFDAAITGPEWSDAVGWGGLDHYGSIRVATLPCRASEICGNGLDDDCAGGVDDGCAGPDAGVADAGVADASLPPRDGAVPDGGRVDATPGMDASSASDGGAGPGNALSNGCDCQASRSDGLPSLLLWILVLAATVSARRRRA
jgi:MYXO-CTERM domain-containing protein